MRDRLRRLSMQKSRIVLIHYPDSNVVDVLLHKDYVTDPIAKLSSHNIQHQSDFNPLSQIQRFGYRRLHKYYKKFTLSTLSALYIFGHH